MGYERRCAIMDCMRDIGGCHQTCDIPEHRALETQGVKSHTAMFQLHHRLEWLKIYHAPDKTTSFGDEDVSLSFLLREIVKVELDSHPSKPESGNTKTWARFGRWRTHNEELCVATCGVILGRATMYGSGGPNGVRICTVATYSAVSLCT